MWIYVIGTIFGHKKIGFGKSTQTRLKQLQTGNPERLEVLHKVEVPDGDARRIEKTAHLHLAEWRLTGEWFDVDLDTAIQAVDRAVNPTPYGVIREEERQRRLAEIQTLMAVNDEKSQGIRREISALKERLRERGDELLSLMAEWERLNGEKTSLM